MKSIVIYSSLTGNTKQVAEAITSVLPAGTPCVSMKELPLRFIILRSCVCRILGG